MSTKEKQKLMKAKRPRIERPKKPQNIPTPSFHPVNEQPEPTPSTTQSPTHLEEQPSSSHPPKQTPIPEHPDIAGPSGTPTTFWPDDTNSSIPLHLYQHFNLPAEDQLFDDYSDRQLLFATALHQGRALGMFSRLVDRQIKKTGSTAKLKAKYKALKKEKKKILNEKASLESSNATLQQQIEAFYGVAAERKNLQQKVSELTAELAEKTESNEILRQQNGNLQAEVHRQDSFLKSAFNRTEELEKANEELKEIVRTGTPEIRQQIIQEYQSSQELQDRVMEQYSEGFEAAIKKASEAGIDPAIFYDSEDDPPEQ